MFIHSVSLFLNLDSIPIKTRFRWSIISRMMRYIRKWMTAGVYFSGKILQNPEDVYLIKTCYSLIKKIGERIRLSNPQKGKKWLG